MAETREPYVTEPSINGIRLSLQGGNILWGDSVIFYGNSKLFEFYRHGENLYVIGDNLTFLQVHETAQVDQVGWLSEIFYRYQKGKINNEPS